MANMNCTDKQNSIKDGRCCDRCPAGKFVKEDCNATNTTKCSECPQGSFTDELNYLKQCIPCQTCINNSLKERHCTTKTNTVCKCKEGFYCSEAKCDHCEPWTLCPVGEGVKIQPTPTTNTVCAPCGNGTYSNITDYSSSCKLHFRCEDYGLQLKTPGTSATDAICQNYCSWILPAGLWAGLVLTIVVLAAFIFWRRKRRSYRAGRTSVPVTVVEIVPKPLIPPPELPSHCQESCKLPFCPSDDTQIIHSIEDSLGSSLPITPLKVSVSFAECNHTNDSSGYCTSKFFRSYSEPQEDEWCGT